MNSDFLNEKKDDLLNSLENIKSDFFDDYDFNTKAGKTSDDLTTLEGFEAIAVDDDEPVEFKEFKKIIKHDFFTNDESDYKLSDFDWYSLEKRYSEVCSTYKEYKFIMMNVEDNLTGDQTVETVHLLSEEEIKQCLFELYLENNDIYEITCDEYGHQVMYMPNDKTQKDFNL